MNPEQQRRAIAERCGIDVTMQDICKCGDSVGSHHMGGNEHSFVPMDDEPLPNYLTDLNAMHTAEECLGAEEARQYHNELGKQGCVWLWHATARQRAYAFCKVIEKAKAKQ